MKITDTYFVKQNYQYNIYLNILNNVYMLLISLENQINLDDMSDTFSIDITEIINLMNSKCINYSDILGDKNPSRNLIKAIKLYEHFFGFPAKQEQLDIIKDIFNDMKTEKTNKPRIHQLLMGGGKTSFIIPILGLYTMMNKNLPDSEKDTSRNYNRFLYVLPTTLVKQSINIISKNLAYLIPSTIKSFNIER